MGYDVTSRVFHWLTVLLVLVMVLVGLTMVQQIPRSIQDPLFVVHKGLGPLVFALVVLRLGWRALRPAPPLPATMPHWERLAARASHAGLYALLLAMPVSGYVRVAAGGFPLEALDALGVPRLVAKNEPLAEAASEVHATLAFLLIALVAVHVAAAIRHATRGDGIMARMWPPIP